MKALGAAAAGLNIANNARDIAAAADALKSGNLAGAASVTVSIGSSRSHSLQTTQSDAGKASSLSAGGDVSLSARGAGADSNILVQGSDINAGGNATLQADKAVTLQAAQDRFSEQSSQSSSGASLGVSYGAGGWGVSASANRSGGNGNGDATTQQNTHVSAGNTLTIQSGGDTSLNGAVASGHRVVAEVGGDLNISSQQDTATYRAKSASSGGSLAFGGGQAGGSISGGQTAINSDYASANESSALRAGDGGFDVQVKGDTTLSGGQITSTEAAVQNGANRFETGGQLAMVDVNNKAQYSADAASITINASLGPRKDAKGNTVTDESGQPINALSGGGTPGIGSDKGSASSVTTSGISGIAGNTAVRTGDGSSGIKPIFDVAKVTSEINAQTTITGQFVQQASTTVDQASSDARKALYAKLKTAQSDEERNQIQSQVDQVNLQERALGILIGAVSGMTQGAVTQGGLAIAADKMRALMIEDSAEFAGVVDAQDNKLSNLSAASEGVNDDGKKIGGTRIDLDLLCGAANERCKTDANGNLALDAENRVQFDQDKAGMSMSEFIATPEGQKMIGATGGIQGAKGTLFGVPYAPGSWQDQLIEAFAGPHDYIGGSLSGLYDEQGNAARDRSNTTIKSHDIWSATGAIAASAPIAAAGALPPNVWQAISIILGAAR